MRVFLAQRFDTCGDTNTQMSHWHIIFGFYDDDQELSQSILLSRFELLTNQKGDFCLKQKVNISKTILLHCPLFVRVFDSSIYFCDGLCGPDEWTSLITRTLRSKILFSLDAFTQKITYLLVNSICNCAVIREREIL